MARLVLRRIAQRDASSAARWYEGERSGLGREFLDALDELLERVADFPLQFPLIDGSVRRGLPQRFPFCVYFKADEKQVVVFAVLHLHRSPASWKRRPDGAV